MDEMLLPNLFFIVKIQAAMQSINFYGSISFLGLTIGIFGRNLELLKSSGFYIMQKLFDRPICLIILLAIFAKSSPKRLQFFK